MGGRPVTVEYFVPGEGEKAMYEERLCMSISCDGKRHLTLQDNYTDMIIFQY